MDILFITSRFPYPPFKGDKIRAYYPIKELSGKHTIDLISFSEEKIDEKSFEEIYKYCKNVNIIALNKIVFLLLQILGIFSPWPSQVLCYHSFTMAKRIKQLLNCKKYDRIHIVCGRIARYGKGIDDIEVGIDWIDALSLSTHRMYKAERNVIKKIVYFIEWRKIYRYEKKWLKKYDVKFITSLVDKEYLQDEAFEVLPNGVDTNIFYPLKTHRDIDLIFTGNMGYFPNIHAVIYFCRQIFPKILEKRKYTKLYIVGANPDRKILKFNDNKKIFVTGFIDDMNLALNRAKIFIAPLLSGAGIQNKILEAMACKTPVVSTTYGNAGINAKDDQEIYIRDSAFELVEIILQLLNDKKKRDDLAEKAYKFVKNKYSWESKVNQISKRYNLSSNISVSSKNF